MPTIQVCRGIQGIGKSYYAKELIATSAYVRFNKDDIRSMESSSYERSNGDLVDDTMHAFIEAALAKNLNIVLDNTFCFMKHIDDIINRYHIYADIEIVSFPNDISLALRQNESRTSGYIEPKIIKEFSKAYDKSTASLQKKGYATYTKGTLLIYKIPRKIVVPQETDWDDTKNLVAVFDIDSTLSIKGDRDVYDFKKCGIDTIVESTYYVYHGLRDMPFDAIKPIFVTGRGEEARKETLAWLQDKVDATIESNQLFMRPAFSFSRDSIVKEAIFHKIRKDNHVVAWFEDSWKVRKEFLIPYKIPFFDTTYSFYP